MLVIIRDELFWKAVNQSTIFLRVSSTLGGVYPKLERINHVVQQDVSKMSVEHLEKISMQPGLLDSWINRK